MFSIYALLGETAPSISNESLASDLNRFFRDEKDFKLQLELLPFSKKSVALRWGNWLARISYEEGENVAQDSREVSKIVGAAVGQNLRTINRRIRVVFGDDDTQEYTNQIICLLDFLRGIEGAILFDPQQGDLFKR
jgi:hypothetical protein